MCKGEPRVFPRRDTSRRRKKKSALHVEQLVKGEMPTFAVSQMSILALTNVPGKAGGKQLDRNNVSPLKKLFIIKQIMVKSGLVFNPTSG